MTTIAIPREREDAASTLLRQARWSWFVRGVRRTDRAHLAAELRAELMAADDLADVVGTDPAGMVRDWADARGVSDRRLRLALLLPATLLPGVMASGAVMATLYQAFTANGHTFLNRISGPDRLATYAGTGLVALVAMIAGAGVALGCVRDATLWATVRTFAWSLPLGSVLAISSGVGVASARSYDSSRDSVEIIIATVIATLSLVLAAARWIVVRRQHSQ